MSYERNANRFTPQAIEASAEHQGLDVFWSDDSHLLIDLDSPDTIAFDNQFDMLLDTHPYPELFGDPQVFHSKSGNIHIVIKLNGTLSLTERLALQAFLGSDIKRELLSYVGMLHGQANPSVLFRPKGTVGQIK